MGERGFCRAWRWFGRRLSLPVYTILPLALSTIVTATRSLRKQDLTIGKLSKHKLSFPVAKFSGRGSANTRTQTHQNPSPVALRHFANQKVCSTSRNSAMGISLPRNASNWLVEYNAAIEYIRMHGSVNRTVGKFGIFARSEKSRIDPYIASKRFPQAWTLPKRGPY